MEEAIQSEENEIKLEVLDQKISDLSQLVALESFKQAWQSEFATRVNHNYHNRNENKQAESIVSSILDCKDVYNLPAVTGLAEIAKENKTIDGKYSLYSDFLRVAFATGIILINEYYQEDEVIRPVFKYTPIVVQLAAMLKTSYHGYQAAITRHLSNELTNSFCTVVDDFIQEYNQSQPTSYGADLNSNIVELKRHHHQGFAALPRNLGTSLNLLSMASNLPRLVLEYFPTSIPFLGEKQNMGSYLAIAGGILSFTGKRFSVFAAESSEKIIQEKMQEAASNFNSFRVDVNESQANLILEKLTSNYKDRLVGPNFMTRYVKLPINFAKDSFYGSSYQIFNQLKSCFASTVPAVETQEGDIELASPIDCSLTAPLGVINPIDSAFNLSRSSKKPENAPHPKKADRVSFQNSLHDLS